MSTPPKAVTVAIERGNTTFPHLWYKDFVGVVFRAFHGRVEIGGETHKCYFTTPTPSGRFILACDATVLDNGQNVPPVGSTPDENRDTPSDEPPRPFEVGDPVASLAHGYGEVVLINSLGPASAYPIHIQFERVKGPLYFTRGGKEYTTDPRRSLFHVDEKPQVTTVPLPLPSIEKGTLVWAWDSDRGEGSAVIAIYDQKDGPRHRVCTKPDPNRWVYCDTVRPYQPEKTDD